jgi:putative oxidoreductase
MKEEVMSEVFENKFRDELILVARIFLVTLFLIFGWTKLSDFNGTISYMTAMGAPLPHAAAAIAVLMEILGSIAILLGAWARPVAILLIVYTLGTSIIGHRYWNMSGNEEFNNMINFYKNLSIIGGLL